MLAIIDGDLVAYRTAASCKEGDPPEVAFQRADWLLRVILAETGATEYQLWLSGNENFRKVINPEYKANRKEQVPPQWLQDTREFLVTTWGAKLSHNREADDELGINQVVPKWGFGEEDTIICSLDKDLKMVPGRHYSWEITGTKPNGEQWLKEASFTTVDPWEGDKTFWKQMLIGDRTDNIIGVQGLGPVKAGKLIDAQDDNQEAMEVVLEKYDNDYKRFAMNATCLWIMRGEGSTWYNDLNLTLPNELQHAVEAITSSMKYLMEDMLTEPTTMNPVMSGSQSNMT